MLIGDFVLFDKLLCSEMSVIKLMLYKNNNFLKRVERHEAKSDNYIKVDRFRTIDCVLLVRDLFVSICDG